MTCGSKVRYRSQRGARRTRERLRARLRVYACRDCGGYHLTKELG